VGFLLLIEGILLSPLVNGRISIITGRSWIFKTKNVNNFKSILWGSLQRFFHDNPLPLTPPGGFQTVWHSLFLPVATQRKKFVVGELFHRDQFLMRSW
jgi:hypothetical protein